MPKFIQHATRYLRSSTTISAFLASVERDAEVLRTVRAALPAPVDKHCRHATMDGSTLVITTDSPVWGSRLRFLTPELQTALAPAYGTIGSCRVRIQAEMAACPVSPKDSEMRAQMSRATANHLLETAAAMDDTELADAFRRLARAGGGSD
jgi:hypothetical protein